MNNNSFTLMILIAGAMISCGLLGTVIGANSVPQYDVNRDGQENIVDLSVLAAYLNNLNSK